jgi:phage gp29-like protein
MAVLYDQFGREIPARDTRRPETRELAVAQIRDRWSGYPSNGLTPQRLARIFREADAGDVLRQAELFEEIEEKDPHIASQFQIRKLAVQGLDYEILPAVEDDARAREIADFCREVIGGIGDWDEVLLDMLDALPKGYSMLEILWDISGGTILPSDIKWIHPKKITFWNSLTPRILTEDNQVEGIDPPPFKFIYHRHKARSGYDTRAGILRVCAWMYMFKNYAVKDWITFCEVFGMPLRVGKYQPGANSEDKIALLTAIQSLGSDAAGIISANTEIEFIEAQKTSTLNIFESMTTFCDHQVSKAILGQTLSSEAGGIKGQGSYALGQVHAEVRQDLVEADAKALSKTITQQLLRPLVGFNFGWDVPVPRFRLLSEPPEDLKQHSDIYKTLCEIGFQVSQEHISERFKIPMPQPDETPMTPLAPTAGRDGPPSAPTPEKAKRVVAGQNSAPQFDPDQQVIEGIADGLPAGDGVDISGQIAAIVMRAESYEDMLTEIYASFKDLDSHTFAELMRRAVFAADLWGDYTARRRRRI